MSDALIPLLPVPQRLALAYSPARARGPTLALLALDARLAELVRKKRDPILAQMRLAWWRETLAKPVADWPKGDPVLAALTGWEERAALIELVNGWELLLAEQLDEASAAGFAAGRGAAFGALARFIGLDEAAAPAEQAGRIWALGDLAANLGDGGERAFVVSFARSETEKSREPLPRGLRTLAVLEGLARRGLGMGGSPLLEGPASGLLALRIGLSGR